jgi:holdfast attachment protein HfaB
MSALAKAGVPLVERYDTSVAELELKYANNKLISDQADDGGYRKIMAGSIPGSDYYIVGGITELNFNIRSLGANGDGGGTSSDGLKGTAGANMYVMNIAMDLRMVDTRTLEVVDVVSAQKQIIGRQISAGVFDFLGHTFFDASLGESALEPLQLGVRSVIERSMLEMLTDLYHVPAGACASTYDPLADMHGRGPIPAPQATQANYVPKENINDVPSDQDPYRWYSSSDPATEPRLRGGID